MAVAFRNILFLILPVVHRYVLNVISFITKQPQEKLEVLRYYKDNTRNVNKGAYAC